jgi:hypothetical protein
MQQSEEWKDIEEFSGYQISNFGKIKSFKHDKINGRLLKLNNDKYGYNHIILSKNNKTYIKKIHRLVFETFIEKLDNGYIIHHIDENKKNNKINNLIKMSLCEHNIYHNKGEKSHFYNSHRFGKDSPMFGKNHSEKSKNLIKENHTNCKGENNTRSKLTKIKIIDIRKLCDEKKLTLREIAKLFNVTPTTISYIKDRKSWSNI